MTMFRTWGRLHATLACTLFMGLGLPAAANAEAGDPPPPPAPPMITLSQEQHDTQLTHFSLHVSCAPESVPCAGTVRLAWRTAALQSFAPSGPTMPLGAPGFNLQPGQDQTVQVVVAASKLRDVLARRAPAAAMFDYTAEAADGTNLGDVTAYGYVTQHDMCGAPAYVPFTGALTEQVNNGAHLVTQAVQSGEIESGRGVTATQPTRIHLLGVTYDIPVGAEILLSCSGLTDYHHGAMFPTIRLLTGTVHVTGKPTSSRQFAVSVYTNEGSLGSRSGEAIDFTVREDNVRHISTMRVVRGRTTQITPNGTTNRSPCTTGQGLRVDRGGHISKA